MLLFDVTRDFAICVDHLFTKDQATLKTMESLGISYEEGMRFVANHENRTLFLRNLCDQVAKVESNRYLKDKKKFKNKAIAEAAQIFVHGIIESRRQSLLSEAEKDRIRSKDDLKNHVATLIREVPHETNQNKNG